jgi:hypothetical protein
MKPQKHGLLMLLPDQPHGFDHTENKLSRTWCKPRIHFKKVPAILLFSVANILVLFDFTRPNHTEKIILTLK